MNRAALERHLDRSIVKNKNTAVNLIRALKARRIPVTNAAGAVLKPALTDAEYKRAVDFVIDTHKNYGYRTTTNARHPARRGIVTFETAIGAASTVVAALMVGMRIMEDPAAVSTPAGSRWPHIVQGALSVFGLGPSPYEINQPSRWTWKYTTAVAATAMTMAGVLAQKLRRVRWLKAAKAALKKTVADTAALENALRAFAASTEALNRSASMELHGAACRRMNALTRSIVDAQRVIADAPVF